MFRVLLPHGLEVDQQARQKGLAGVKNGKGKKVLVFKYKPKKNYRRRQGHRQPYTKVEITKVNA